MSKRCAQQSDTEAEAAFSLPLELWEQILGHCELCETGTALSLLGTSKHTAAFVMPALLVWMRALAKPVVKASRENSFPPRLDYQDVTVRMVYLEKEVPTVPPCVSALSVYLGDGYRKTQRINALLSAFRTVLALHTTTTTPLSPQDLSEILALWHASDRFACIRGGSAPSIPGRLMPYCTVPRFVDRFRASLRHEDVQTLRLQ